MINIMAKSTLHRFQQLGLIALLVLLIGQVGLLAHKVAAEHALETSCELCVQLERVAIAAPVLPPAVFIVAALFLSLALHARTSLGRKYFPYYLRGPPAL